MKYTITITDETGNKVDSVTVDTNLETLTKTIKGLDSVEGEVPHFEMKYVGNRSSNVESVGWLNESLYVKFQHSTALYRYDGVPHKVFDEAMSADSIGKYIIANVKDKYLVSKVN